ncbi:MAG TPA: membrane protein insertion efficiency factor YidD [Myxococcota bacterium]|nr:membrane protein insertion efficiency factor YidD [Myxococcota bacterium]
MRCNFLQQIALVLIRIYQLAISPLFPPCCRFFPSCSSYAHEAIVRFGFVEGMFLTTMRLLKCHPLHEGGFDPVPCHARKKSCRAKKD